MKKIVMLILCVILIFSLCSCGHSDSTESTNAAETAKPESSNQDMDPVVASDAAIAPLKSVPNSLVFTADGSGQYNEPALGEWESFLSKLFKSYESGEVDPGSGIIKYFGEGNDGYGYCLLVTTRSDKTGILSYNIDTAIVSAEPDSGGG